MKVYKLVLGQILRHIFTGLAIYLAVFKVDETQQSELVETTINYVLPLILLGVGQLWSFLQKKYFPQLLESALQANPLASVEDVKRHAKQKTKTPVVY